MNPMNEFCKVDANGDDQCDIKSYISIVWTFQHGEEIVSVNVVSPHLAVTISIRWNGKQNCSPTAITFCLKTPKNIDLKRDVYSIIADGLRTAT